MYRIVGTIKGLAPVLFNRVLATDIPGEGGDDQASKGRITREDRLKEAEERAYTNHNGLYVPGTNLKQSFLEGAKKSGLKVGRSSIYSYVEAAVFFDRELYFIDKKERDFIHEWWGRRPPRTGGICMVRRPALREGWELAFGMTVVDNRRSPGEIRRCLDEAGLLVGLGSWRPEYGRFIVVRFEKEE